MTPSHVESARERGHSSSGSITPKAEELFKALIVNRDTPSIESSEPVLLDTASHAVPTPIRHDHNLFQGTRSCPTDSDSVEAPHTPTVVPGYQIEGVLGTGGMGTVYLARQLSLDRQVALKVMSQVWASDPVFVARFTREAYAAAQLNHQNVVRIYDIGEVGKTRYFSMEYVDGKTLSELIREQGKIDPDRAVGYILQAARGLKHAHDRGIVHRDVKPDNLLLDAQGVVKVADLGLVKTPHSRVLDDQLSDDSSSASGLLSLPTDMTGVRMALGTPAYMAPEQCRDAASVDHRADIYSLGCTLYALVTGRQPFHASDSVGLMKKHAYEQPIPPDLHNPRLPRELSQIILRMMSKQPGDRYRTMGDLIKTLEIWLGQGDEVTPSTSLSEAEINSIEDLSRAFRYAPSCWLRERLIRSYLIGCLGGGLLLLLFGHGEWAVGAVTLAFQAALAYFVLNGWTRRTHLYRRARRLIRESSRGDAIVFACSVGLFAALLWLTQLFWIVLGCSLLGIAAAVVLWYAVDRKLEAERYPIFQSAEQIAKQLRQRGVSEPEIRYFFARHLGRHWEELYERLFGYEAKISARAILLRGGFAGRREKFASWREPIIALMTHLESLRKQARDAALLEETEYRRLLAAGMSRRQARRRAAAVASELIDLGHDVGVNHSLSHSTPHFNAALQVSMTLPGLAEPAEPRSWLYWPLDVLTGPWLRILLSAVLIAACGLWMFQNGILAGAPGPIEPLQIHGVPSAWTSWCDSANVGWAGMLLLGSLFFPGIETGFLVILGAAVTVFGHHLGIRSVPPIQDFHVSMMVGTVLALLGYRFGRR